MVRNRLPLSVPSSSSPGSHGSREPPATQIPSTSILSSHSSSVLLGTTSSSSEAFSSSEDFSDNSFSSDAQFSSVSFINAAAYARCAHLPGSTVFTVTLHNYDSASAYTAQAKAFSAQAEPVVTILSLPTLSHLCHLLFFVYVYALWYDFRRGHLFFFVCYVYGLPYSSMLFCMTQVVT